MTKEFQKYFKEINFSLKINDKVNDSIHQNPLVK